MGQFDVYRNPSIAARAVIPYVVNIQSDLLDSLPTRLTIPLGAASAHVNSGPKTLCPMVEFGDQELGVLAHLTVAFRTRDLGKKVGSLDSQSALLVRALDAVLSGV